MDITINGAQHDWDVADPSEAVQHRHLQRCLAVLQQEHEEDKKIITDQMSACVRRTRDKYQRRSARR